MFRAALILSLAVDGAAAGEDRFVAADGNSDLGLFSDKASCELGERDASNLQFRHPGELGFEKCRCRAIRNSRSFLWYAAQACSLTDGGLELSISKGLLCGKQVHTRVEVAKEDVEAAFNGACVKAIAGTTIHYLRLEPGMKLGCDCEDLRLQMSRSSGPVFNEVDEATLRMPGAMLKMNSSSTNGERTPDQTVKASIMSTDSATTATVTSSWCRIVFVFCVSIVAATPAHF